jgi:DNA-binding transcriptional MerR regulator
MEKKLLDRMLENYTDILDFVNRSGVPLSFETVRRAIKDIKPVSIPSLILICKYLGFTKEEIKDIIKELGDQDFHELIGDQNGMELTQIEEAIIVAIRKIRQKEPLSLNTLATQIELIAKAYRVDVSEEFKKILKTELLSSSKV